VCAHSIHRESLHLKKSSQRLLAPLALSHSVDALTTIPVEFSREHGYAANRRWRTGFVNLRSVKLSALGYALELKIVFGTNGTKKRFQKTI
jgi:hypothetical protein